MTTSYDVKVLLVCSWLLSRIDSGKNAPTFPIYLGKFEESNMD